MNKKAINPLSFLIIGLIIIILLGISLLTYWIIIENNKYWNDYNEGIGLLNNLTLSVNSTSPAPNTKLAGINLIINGTNILDEVNARVTFETKSNDGDDTKQLGNHKISYLDNLPLINNSFKFDTSPIYDKFGNNYNVCTKLEIDYLGVNWLSIIHGYPNRILTNCTSFMGILA